MGVFGKDHLLNPEAHLHQQPWRHMNCIYNSEFIGVLVLLASIPHTFENHLSARN